MRCSEPLVTVPASRCAWGGLGAGRNAKPETLLCASPVGVLGLEHSVPPPNSLQLIQCWEQEVWIPPRSPDLGLEVGPGRVEPDGFRDLDAGAERVHAVAAGKRRVANPSRFPSEPHAERLGKPVIAHHGGRESSAEGRQRATARQAHRTDRRPDPRVSARPAAIRHPRDLRIAFVSRGQGLLPGGATPRPAGAGTFTGQRAGCRTGAVAGPAPLGWHVHRSAGWFHPAFPSGGRVLAEWISRVACRASWGHRFGDGRTNTACTGSLLECDAGVDPCRSTGALEDAWVPVRCPEPRRPHMAGRSC